MRQSLAMAAHADRVPKRTVPRTAPRRCLARLALPGLPPTVACSAVLPATLTAGLHAISAKGVRVERVVERVSGKSQRFGCSGGTFVWYRGR